MPSQKSKASVNKNAVRGNSTRETAAGVVEIDATFGRMIGFAEGQKVGSTPLMTSLVPTIITGRIAFTS